MIINHNMNAMNAHRQMGMNTVQSGKAMEKLSSGLRINRAGDDAAGLAISEKMRGQIRGLDQASRNSQDGISMIQTAEGALNETHSILQRMRELAVQASNDTNTKDDRTQIQKEVNQLTSEINRIGNTTEFNTQKLLDGNKAGEAAKKDSAILVEEDVKGTINFTVKNLAVGDKIEANGITTTIAANNMDSAANLKTALTANFANKDYELDVTGDNTNGFKVSITEKTVKAKITADPTSTNVKLTPKTAGTSTISDISGTKGLAKGDDTGKKLEKDKDGKVNLQVGANEKQSMSIEIKDMRAKALKISSEGKKDGFEVTDGTSDDVKEAALDVTSHANAEQAITKFDKAIEKVSTQRSQLGAYQNRLEHTINNLGTSSENLQAAESRVRDVDMAKEMMNFSKNNILAQAAQAMLAQANQQPQGVLQLLR